jgi:hypothetical protein
MALVGFCALLGAEACQRGTCSVVKRSSLVGSLAVRTVPSQPAKIPIGMLMMPGLISEISAWTSGSISPFGPMTAGPTKTSPTALATPAMRAETAPVVLNLFQHRE